MYGFSISESFSNAWDLIKRNFILVGIYFIACIPAIFTNVASNITSFPGFNKMIDKQDTAFLITFFALLFGIIFIFSVIQMGLMSAFYNAALKVTRGETADFECFKMPATQYVRFIGAQLCVGFLTALGGLLCIIPGIYVNIKLTFVPVILLDDPDCSFSDAFRRSWDMTDGNVLNIFLFQLVCCGVYLLGMLCCCVGVYVAVPVTVLALLQVYQQLKSDGEVIYEEVASEF